MKNQCESDCTFCRSKYLRKKLHIGGGDQNKVIDVYECPPRVLVPLINFIYGIAVPEEFNNQDVKSLFYMAHLFEMEDLKDAIAPRVGEQLSTKNILETSKLALKYNALRLTELCCDFIFANSDGLSSSLLDQLFKVLHLTVDEANGKYKYTNMPFMTPWLKGVVGKNTNANVSGSSVQGGRG